MSAITKTVVATGATSGIGFEVIKQLLSTAQQYNFILGARDVKAAAGAYGALNYDASKHKFTVLPLELNNMKAVKTFAQQTLDELGQNPIDYLLLNAATGSIKQKAKTGPYGSKWIEPYLVNHLSQHYLLHLLRPKLEESKTRIVVVSSGVVRNVKDLVTLENEMLASVDTDEQVYSATKFIQLVSTQWWRRQLYGKCEIVAVSPGLIPQTGLLRGSNFQMPADHPDAKTVPEGAQSVLRAFTRDDLPEDPEQLFLTSWGEWWPKDVYGLALDKNLQEKWSPSQEAIEREEGVTP